MWTSSPMILSKRQELYQFLPSLLPHSRATVSSNIQFPIYSKVSFLQAAVPLIRNKSPLCCHKDLNCAVGFCHGIFVQLVSLSFHTLTVTDAVARTAGCIISWCLTAYPTACNSPPVFSAQILSNKTAAFIGLSYFLCLSISIKPRIIIKKSNAGEHCEIHFVKM